MKNDIYVSSKLNVEAGFGGWVQMEEIEDGITYNYPSSFLAWLMPSWMDYFQCVDII